MWYLVGVLITMTLSAIAGWFAAASRNAGQRGAMLGFFLGPVGVMAALGLDERHVCRNCGGRVNSRPNVCPHCKIVFDWPKQRASGGRSRDYKPSAPQFDE